MSYQVFTIRIPFLLLAIGLFSILQPGCARNDQPELGEVTGTITLDGKPLVGVAVVYQPENGRPARGTTDADGRYELTYIRNTKGTKVGPNRVEIAPSEEGETEEPVEDQDAESKTESVQSKPGKPKIPARYNSQSELNVDVKSGTNTFDFDLQS